MPQSRSVTRVAAGSFVLALTAALLVASPANPVTKPPPNTSVSAYCSILGQPLAYGPCLASSASVFVVDGIKPPNIVGGWSAMTIGKNGKPVIVYQDATAGGIRVMACNDRECRGRNETITPGYQGTTSGTYNAIAIGASGKPVIVFRDATDGFTSGKLRVVTCGNASCTWGGTSSWRPTGKDVAYYNSVAIGLDGYPVISMQSMPDQVLMVIHCGDAKCQAGTGSTFTVVDPLAGVGPFSSIAIGRDGNPVIAYWDSTQAAVKVAKCNDPGCVAPGETLTLVDNPANFVGWWISMTIGADGNPVIAYTDDPPDSLKVAKCHDPACATPATKSTIDDDTHILGDFGTSIALGRDGNPVISYYDGTSGDLKVAECNDPACAGGDETIILVRDPFATATNPAGHDVGRFSSIAVGTDGDPVISYFDATAKASGGGNLLVARVPH